MSSITPPTPAAELQFAPKPQLDAEKGPAAQAADRRWADAMAAQRDDVTIPNKLEVSLDPSAGRFVQHLTDATTEETLRQYPSESQLAYSRAVMAYMRALHDE